MVWPVPTINTTLFFTSAKEPGVYLSVCVSVCLSVTLLATSRKNYRSDLHGN